MIVSHRLRTVFLHTRKAAGSSIELALATACGPDDVITDVGHPELRASLGARPAQNLAIPVPDLTLVFPPWAGYRPRRRHQPRWQQHTLAREAKSVLPRDVWDGYFTFAVERNPWDKAVSRYFWDANRTDGYAVDVPSFSEYIRTFPTWKLSNFDTYTIDGHCAVDRVLRYERLEEELAEVWRLLGVVPPEFPKAKGGTRPSWARDWRVMYRDSDVDVVANRCWQEIEAFGYAFDD